MKFLEVVTLHEGNTRLVRSCHQQISMHPIFGKLYGKLFKNT